MDLDVHLAAIVGGDTRAFGSWMSGAEPRVRDSLRSFAQVIARARALRELEAALDPDGLSTTARAVLARIEGRR